MILCKTLRRISLGLFALSVMLLLGVRMYESTYIYSSEVMTVTHVLTPLLLPLIGISLAGLIVFAVLVGILSAVQRRKDRKNNV